MATTSGLTNPARQRTVSGAPTISVVIPCRNMGAYVGAAIDSVFAQAYAVHEVIVIDDKSDDDTLQVLESFGARITVLEGPGRGSSVARNLGILAATGDHVAFLDADDLWLPSRLEQQVKLLSAACGFVFSDWYRNDSPDNPGAPVLPGYSWVCEGEVFSNLLRENFISTSSVLLRKDLLAHTGLFKPKLIGAQDFDLWLRLARRTQFACVREPLVFMRAHRGNITGSRQYPYHVARLWAEVLQEHSDSKATDLTYMRSRYGKSLYDAGRHAVRLLDVAMARHHFALAWKARYSPAHVVFWYAVTRMPHWLMSWLLRLKRSAMRVDRIDPREARRMG
jgi:glycosyltransferase involved in cell wall biosynthesis